MFTSKYSFAMNGNASPWRQGATLEASEADSPRRVIVSEADFTARRGRHPGSPGLAGRPPLSPGYLGKAHVFRRQSLPCDVCGTSIVRTTVAGRATTCAASLLPIRGRGPVFLSRVPRGISLFNPKLRGLRARFSCLTRHESLPASFSCSQENLGVSRDIVPAGC